MPAYQAPPDPPSVQRLRDMARAIPGDDQLYGVGPANGQGLAAGQLDRDRLWSQAADERERLKRVDQDAQNDANPNIGERVRQDVTNRMDRSQYDAVNNHGFAAQWKPFFEAYRGTNLGRGLSMLDNGDPALPADPASLRSLKRQGGM